MRMYCILDSKNNFNLILINSRILSLLNKRQLEKLKDKWWRNEDFLAKCDKTDDQSEGISIYNIGGVFIVIFIGIGMACITLAFEYWFFKYRKNPRIIDVAEAKPSNRNEKDSDGIVVDSVEKEDTKSDVALRPRFSQHPSSFKHRF